jgi:AraC family transcriptional regulator of adaptative response/methylated-DNA-[protein]-cysteine methyltransferase
MKLNALAESAGPPLAARAGRPLPSSRTMYRAFRRADASYDGVFYTGVRTTGIFCRPSCRAKKPRPENVQFFPSAGDALFAGYRACKRCRPLAAGGHPSWVERLLRVVEQSDGARITEKELRAMQIDPARARRYFQDRFGMTFQAYSRSRRLGTALSQLRLGLTLDDAAADSGFESLSGFRDAFARVFGAPPGQAERASAVEVAYLETPLGPMLAGARESRVCLLEFTNRRMIEAQIATLRRRLRAAFVPAENEVLSRLRSQLAEYFAGRLTQFTLPLEAPGTPFEERVWRELLGIPYGETRSYQDLARAVGAPKASRAVGRANGMNRIAIVIPCHRVVNKDGQLGGYGGGLWRKHALLHLERTRQALTTAAGPPPADRSTP